MEAAGIEPFSQVRCISRRLLHKPPEHFQISEFRDRQPLPWSALQAPELCPGSGDSLETRSGPAEWHFADPAWESLDHDTYRDEVKVNVRLSTIPRGGEARSTPDDSFVPSLAAYEEAAS